MNTKEIEILISQFENSSLNRMKVSEGEFLLELEKGLAPLAYGSGAAPAPEAVNTAPAAAAKLGMATVTAPLVGVYYAAPSPDSEPYVKVGDKVEKGQTLCLIEAMKMMNELKAPVDGIVKAINAENGQMVEFGQVILEVEPC